MTDNSHPCSDAANNKSKPFCCGCHTLSSELCSISFFPTSDGTGQVIDMDCSFVLKNSTEGGNEINYGYYMKATAKFIFWAASMLTVIITWVTYDVPYFYPAYLTHWSLIAATIYLSMSLLLTLSTKKEPSTLLNRTWFMFSIASVSQICIVILFWTLDYVPGDAITWATVARHGAVMLFVLVDGLIVNRIPVRMDHVVGPFLFSATYLIWCVVQNVVCECNPMTDNEAEDDALYTALRWKSVTTTAIIISAFTIFVLVPFIHTVVWSLSYCNRIYKTSDDDKGDDDENSGSVADKNVAIATGNEDDGSDATTSENLDDEATLSFEEGTK